MTASTLPHALRTLELPARRYLMVDGSGDPNASGFQDALGALYPVAYAVKFASKNDLGRDYVVPPLEALWWADELAVFTAQRDKSRWKWTLLSLVPDWIDAETVQSILTAREAGAAAPVRLETLEEGLCVQTLHVGPFDDEGEILAEMHHAFPERAGHILTGTHHEISLSDLRRVPPERQRTILRQPIRPAAPSPRSVAATETIVFDEEQSAKGRVSPDPEVYLRRAARRFIETAEVTPGG
ncbi:GyrI-like domain-containing protein [Herbiconiux sp.]|uniref:GyrI-like domain-containing protein n=1 Tax=Herbiconiux sp. TaxID=1871186 RepID=UPI0025BD9F27|nr:GyrI-like domain-containing protein [Herbiconiux sp.]